MNKHLGTHFDYTVGYYHQNSSISEAYKRFKQNHYKRIDDYNRREYTPIPNRSRCIEKTTKELKNEKKCFSAKTLYSNYLSFNNVFRYCNMLSVSEADFLSRCLNK